MDIGGWGDGLTYECLDVHERSIRVRKGSPCTGGQSVHGWSVRPTDRPGRTDQDGRTDGRTGPDRTGPERPPVHGLPTRTQTAHPYTDRPLVHIEGRDARGRSGSLGVARGRSWSFVVIRGHSWSFVVIRGHSWSFVVIRGRRGHSGSFVVIRGRSLLLVCTA